jgi:uroporphyrinogen III methyltransferase/synthase
VIIGIAADSEASLSWFERKSLFGKNIVITRHEDGNADFAAGIIQRGGNPIEFATMKIRPLIRKDSFQNKLGKLERYDWVAFTSVNGVTVFFDYLESLRKDARVLGGVKVAAIGAETAAKLKGFGIRADFVPAVYTSEELGKGLIDFVAGRRGKKKSSGTGGDLHQARILLLRSELASNELAGLLKDAGAQVDEVAVYGITAEKSQAEWLKPKIAAGQIDWITFTSPFSVRVFFEKIPTEVVNSSDVKVASIGPVTSKQLEELGVKVDVEPAEHTIDGLLEAIESADKEWKGYTLQ